MTAVLVTGMSGTGKSPVLEELARGAGHQTRRARPGGSSGHGGS
jgi:dephospho-CoA kinase